MDKVELSQLTPPFSREYLDVLYGEWGGIRMSLDGNLILLKFQGGNKEKS
jgi:hypothetical protein